ncbi:MAG: MFS transporter [Rhodococcus sp. (in: high G+C Gram-positive bacteria)]
MTEQVTSPKPAPPSQPRAPREKLNPMARKALLAGTVGTLIEWFDYGLYGAAAGLIINNLFFPTLGGTAGTLAAFATFAVGFFARPVGGLVIAHLGDKYGRKPVLVGTLIMMGSATVLMGALPTYQQIGVWAAVLLVALRILQGAGAGAELAGAMTLVAEYSPKSRRSFVTSVPNACGSGGILLATLAFLAVSNLPESSLLSWGWRIPFLMSGILFVVALYIRNKLEETPEFAAAKARMVENGEKQKVPLAQLVRTHPREVVFGFLSITGHNANFYILNTFSLSYMVNQLDMSRTDSLIAMAAASVSALVAAPLMGNVADRIGARRVFRFGAINMIVLAFPLFWALTTANLLIICIALMISSAAVFGFTAGGQGGFLTNLFPTKYRFSGIAITREMNSMLIAGPTPFIAAALVAGMSGAPWLVAAYLVICGTVSVIALSCVRERYGKSDDEVDE